MKKIFLLVLILLCAHPTFAKGKVKAPPSMGNGYVGSLPDPTERFPKATPASAPPIFNSVDGFNNQNELKPVPRSNPAFVNIILKKDKTSSYINDLNYIIPIIEKIQKDIDDNGSVQKFSAEANYLKENVDYLRDKYKNKPEGSYISFKKLMQLNLDVQTVSQLRRESAIYSPYVAYSGNGRIYSPNSINQQMEYLQKNIETTLFILKEAK